MCACNTGKSCGCVAPFPWHGDTHAASDASRISASGPGKLGDPCPTGSARVPTTRFRKTTYRCLAGGGHFHDEGEI